MCCYNDYTKKCVVIMITLIVHDYSVQECSFLNYKEMDLCNLIIMFSCTQLLGICICTLFILLKDFNPLLPEFFFS